MKEKESFQRLTSYRIVVTGDQLDMGSEKEWQIKGNIARILKIEENLRNILYNMKRNNIHIMGIPEEKRATRDRDVQGITQIMLLFYY